MSESQLRPCEIFSDGGMAGRVVQLEPLFHGWTTDGGAIIELENGRVEIISPDIVKNCFRFTDRTPKEPDATH